MDDDVADRLLESIQDGSLAIVCGAGLSMAKPSSLPGAAGLAKLCVEKYEERYGKKLPEGLDSNLDKLALYFDNKGILETVFINHVVPWAVFVREFNKGHRAVADLLHAKAICSGITTNYDSLIETAAQALEQEFESALDGFEANIERRHSTFLKIHGCAIKNKLKTIWCKPQTGRGETARTLQSIKQWLGGHLMARSLVFVGFWSDWDYLNDVLTSCVSDIMPSNVVLVDPQEPERLQAKAKELWTWASAKNVRFHHEQAYGQEFLDDLRKRYSVRFIRTIFQRSLGTYAQISGSDFQYDANSLAQLESEVLYELRRSLAGVPRNRAVHCREPDEFMVPAAVAHMYLLSKGAQVAGGSYLLDQRRIRVVAGSGPLSLTKSRFEEEPPSPQPDDYVICAGATQDGAHTNIVRGTGKPSTIRPGVSGDWITLDAAIQLFGQVND